MLAGRRQDMQRASRRQSANKYRSEGRDQGAYEKAGLISVTLFSVPLSITCLQIVPPITVSPRCLTTSDRSGVVRSGQEWSGVEWHNLAQWL